MIKVRILFGQAPSYFEFAPLFRKSESVNTRIAVGRAKESRKQRYILPPTLGLAMSHTGQRIIKSQLKTKYWWLMCIPTSLSPVVCPAQIRGQTYLQFGPEIMMIIPHLCCHGDRNCTVRVIHFLEAVILATALKLPLYNQEIFKVRWVLSAYLCLIHSRLRLRSADKGDRFLPPGGK